MITSQNRQRPSPRNGRGIRPTEGFFDLLGLMSATFTRVFHDQIDTEIDHWLERTGRALDLDRLVIGHYLTETRDFRAVHQWTRNGFVRAPMFAASEVIPWISTRTRAGEIVAVPGVGFLPPVARCDKRFMLSAIGPKAVLVMPLSVGDKLLAGMTFADLYGERLWPPALVSRVKLVADIFANVLERRRAAMETNSLREEVRQTARASLIGEMTADGNLQAAAGLPAHSPGQSMRSARVLVANGE